MKLCKDCKWSKDEGEYAKCLRPVGVSVVDGSVTYHQWKYCEILRNDPGWHPLALLFKCCTRSGRYWEPRHD